MQSCKLNRANIPSFIQLALIYTAMGETDKGQMIIHQLYHENSSKAIVLVTKAYMEADKFLHQIDKDPSIEISDQFKLREVMLKVSREARRRTRTRGLYSGLRVILSKTLSPPPNH